MRHKPGRAIAFSLRTECIPSCQVPTCHSIDIIDRSSNSSYKHRWLLSHHLTFIKCVDRYLQVDYKGLSFCGLRVYQQVILTGEAKSCEILQACWKFELDELGRTANFFINCLYLWKHGRRLVCLLPLSEAVQLHGAFAGLSCVST